MRSEKRPETRDRITSLERDFECRAGIFRKKRSAKGSGSAGHLIHRGAVPLPLEGKDKVRLKVSGCSSIGRYCLLPIAYCLQMAGALVTGHWSLVTEAILY